MKNLILKIIRGSYPPVSPKYSYDIRNLISGLLKKNPEERPALSTLLRKGFVKRAMESQKVKENLNIKKSVKNLEVDYSHEIKTRSAIFRKKDSKKKKIFSILFILNIFVRC